MWQQWWMYMRCVRSTRHTHRNTEAHKHTHTDYNTHTCTHAYTHIHTRTYVPHWDMSKPPSE